MLNVNVNGEICVAPVCVYSFDEKTSCETPSFSNLQYSCQQPGTCI